MKSRKKEYLLQRISKKKQAGKVSLFVGMYFVLFLALILYASLRVERFRAASLYLEDALAASNLGAAMVNLKEYGRTHKVLVASPHSAFETYKYLICQNLGLDQWYCPTEESVIEGRVEIACFVVYNVDGDWVTEYRFVGEKQEGVKEYPIEEAVAPNGIRIENTSVYSEIKFLVECFPNLYVDAHKGKLIDIVINDGR